LASTGPQIGRRDRRRVRGRDQVCAADGSAARKPPHVAVARSGWPMENHLAPGVTAYRKIAARRWYHLAYGAICAASTENLWAGGRLTSSDNRAYASLRVMGTSFATGHACGVAAAVYADGGRHDYAAVREGLERQGALV